MRQVLLSGVAIAMLVAGGIAGCSGADEHPLGGPYGGSGGTPNPSHGDGTGNPDPGTGDDAGDPGTGDDSGSTNPPPPGVDSGTHPPPGHDSGTNPPPPGQDSGTSPPPNSAPTWSQIWSMYFANGTVGRCPSCHSQTSSASKMYTWMQGKGYISGTSSAIVSTSRSDISWFGGGMPPSGPTSNASAVSDMKAWVAAGAQNN